MIELYHGDCLDIMPIKIPDKSIDMILCDLPYGTTQNKWDTVIPLEPLWEQYERTIKPNGVIALTAQTPFDKVLGVSNLKILRYEWIWEKTRKTGFLNAKKMPLKKHENVLVFYKKPPKYNPQGITKLDKPIFNRGIASSTNYGKANKESWRIFTNYPHDIIKVDSVGKTIHPTQKPVALLEYLIKTYTNEGDTVLDNCMGSGSTGVACVNTKRNFIGIEKDETYFNIAKKRIEEAEQNKKEELFRND
jgi:site-specific DNA-methyltransferase (adenine-specific)